MQTIVEKWHETGMLQGIKETKMANLAHCMQAQVEFNNSGNEDPAFKRMSIPIVNRVMRGSRAFDRNHFDLSDGMNEAQHTHVFATKFAPPAQGSEHNLQVEAEYASKLSESLRAEFDQLFGDQYNKYITIHGFEATPNGQILLHYDM